MPLLQNIHILAGKNDMIVPQIKIHDNYSFEFKIGFVPDNETADINEFKINTWFFLPNSLDINSSTYTKDQFYKGVKNNIRLITPIYTLQQILQEGRRGPLPRLEKAIENLLTDTESEEKTENYAYQIKMFACIMKSALRDEAFKIEQEIVDKKIEEAVRKFVQNIRLIASQYREKYKLLDAAAITEKQRDYFLFADEFLGNVIEQYAFRIMIGLKREPVYEQVQPILTELVEEELAYKQKMGFHIPEEGNNDHNKLVIIKRNILKKFVESDLYLQTTKKKDGAFAEQMYYSVAAGIAMIFATVISFFATLRYGNFTADLFIVLVVSYMLKDRIKDLMRYYFSSHMSRKYFDIKHRLNIRHQEIGWIKEAFDFIPETKVPDDILNLRNRTPLVEAENEIYDEKIILYRKLVHLSKTDIEKYKEYQLSGINDITRFSVLQFVQKMDNPTLPLYLSDKEKGYKEMIGYREYPLYLVLACESNEETHYRKYRILFSRNGISDVSELG